MRPASFVCLATIVLLVTPVFAGPVIDPNASEVQLRKSCADGAGYLDDCFETTADLTSWLWSGGRNDAPSALDPVLVRVGTGEFDPMICVGTQSDPDGWVSFQGAGRENTRFVQAVKEVAAIDVTHCTRLEFSDLTAYGVSDEFARGVYWKGSGRGTWSDVDTIAEGLDPSAAAIAWYDAGSGATENLVQYLFGCRVEVRGQASFALAYEAGTAEVWIYGGELVARPIAEAGSPFQLGTWAALWPAIHSDVRVFGSTLRAVTDDAPGVTGTLRGVWAIGQGSLHMHGGIISVNGAGSGADVDVIGVDSVFGGTFVHSPDTAFALVPGGNGTATRLDGAGNYNSPFQWPAGPNPPDVVSVHGADQFVDTNAGGTGQAHLMVYDTSCTGAGGPWRDMATGGCR